MRHLGSVRDSLRWCCAWATFQAESSNSAFGGAFLAPLLGCWKGLLAGKTGRFVLLPKHLVTGAAEERIVVRPVVQAMGLFPSGR
jgi:hypothetical protein